MRREYSVIFLIPSGAALAYLGWVTAGVTVAVVGFVGALAVHLATGIASYRRSMDHEWPKVEPRRWDDD